MASLKDLGQWTSRAIQSIGTTLGPRDYEVASVSHASGGLFPWHIYAGKKRTTQRPVAIFTYEKKTDYAKVRLEDK